MKQTELHFEPTVYHNCWSGSTRTYPMSDDKRICLIIKELKAIHERERNRPVGHNDLPYGTDEYLIKAIAFLEKTTEWPCEDSYGEGKPSIVSSQE
jgi:hypothetical protein